jgi:hypothetical protein
MSPVVQGTKDPDNNEWSWLHLEDFSPGVYDASNVSTARPVVAAPLGAANATGTWCCMALPGGGLGPFPKLTATYTFTPTFPSGVTTLYIVGALVVPMAGGAVNQLLIMVEGDNGTTHFYRAYALNPTTSTFHLVKTITAATQAGIFGSPYPFATRARAATYTKAGTPIAVWPAALTHDSHGNAGHVFVFPTPTHRTTYGVKDLVTPTMEIAGQTYGYANRILVLSGIKYHWPGGALTTNENIAFTTPPNSYTLGNQQTVLAAETPFGYGAAGSISTGELILIKKHGGGVVVNGDIEAPTSVLYLPGIQPTGDIYGQAEGTENGMYYCSTHRGAWVWNGGNTSVKISQQLRDDFFDLQTGAITSNNFGFCVGRWGTWMLFSGNVLYNTTAGAWWVPYPGGGNGATTTPGRDMFWMLGANFGNQFYTAPLRCSTALNGKACFYRFDNTVAAPNWQWESLPIHVVPTANHRVDVREVVVRASCPDAGSTLKVTVGGWSGTSPATAIGTTPSIIRFHVGAGGLGIEDIVLTMKGHQATTGHSSPIIHSVDIAYAIRAHQAAVN